MKDFAAPETDSRVLSRLVELNTAIGVDVVEVAGFLDSLDQTVGDQSTRLSEARSAAGRIADVSRRIRAGVEETAVASEAGLAIVRDSEVGLREAAQRAGGVAEWVKSLAERMAAIEQTLRKVESNGSRITAISKQVDILAINAKIEAVRAGDQGKGFGVVADAVNTLSKATSAAAKGITDATGMLVSSLEEIRAEAAEISNQADQVLADSAATDQALGAIAQEVQKTAVASETMRGQAVDAETLTKGFLPVFDGIIGDLGEINGGVTALRDRVHGMIDYSENAVQASIEAGGDARDFRFIQKVQHLAKQIGAAFEAGLTSGEISETALFSDHYEPIPGSNPPQVMAAFTQFTDRVLPHHQEPVLDFDPRVVFCAAVDTNGYLPTHNAKFSLPQGEDPVWNATHCRNRRIFDDRVGLKAGRNRMSFLMQIYRRDMGGGTFVLMKDLSAPILVKGRHWGGLRLAYKME